MKYHKIGYHVYADDTQLYISFKCKQPLEAILNVNHCLSDIRRWMITNKLKINYSKTECILFRSLQLRCDLSGLIVNVGESQITQSLKVRDLGVSFDQFLNFNYHITAICRSTYFHIRNIGKICYRIMLVLLLFMHLLVVYYIIVIPYCITFLRIKRIDCKDFRINACILAKSPRREHITLG